MSGSGAKGLKKDLKNLKKVLDKLKSEGYSMQVAYESGGRVRQLGEKIKSIRTDERA